jgi:hypothetical protein
MEHTTDSKQGGHPDGGRAPSYVTIGEAARVASVTPRSVRRWIERGYLPSVDGVNGSLVDAADMPGTRAAAEQAATAGQEPRRPAAGEYPRSGRSPDPPAYDVTPPQIEQAIERTGDKDGADRRAMFDRLADIYEGRLADQDALIAAERQRADELQARVAELETKPAAQVTGELATRPAFVPIAPAPPVEAAPLAAEHDALNARVRELEQLTGTWLATASSEPQEPVRRAWWQFWRP